MNLNMSKAQPLNYLNYVHVVGTIFFAPVLNIIQDITDP